MSGRALAASRISRELASGGQMQLRPLGRRDRVVERLLDDRVDEPRRKSRTEELGLDQGVDGVRGRLAVHARHRRGVRQDCVVAEDRQCLGHNPGRLRPPAEPIGHEPSDRRRTQGRDGVDVHVVPTSLLEGGDELSREQRVPTRRSGAFGADLIVRVRAEGVAHQLGDGGRAERRRPDGRQRLTLDQVGQGLRRRGRFASPDRENRAGRDLLDPRLEISEEPKRMLVCPVRIVYEEGKRPLIGQPHAQPVQAVKPCEQAIVGGRSIGNLLEQRPRQSRGPCEDPFALALCQPFDARRQ